MNIDATRKINVNSLKHEVGCLWVPLDFDTTIFY